MNAQLACADDINCQAVNDNGCDGSGAFQICSPSNVRDPGFFADSSNCVYTKGK